MAQARKSASRKAGPARKRARRRSDPLATYRRKRDFEQTPEPGPGRRVRAGGAHFVVQKHAARRLHYDFRLELDGTMKSWAVTRGPSLDPADRRLAVHVEDHPLAYNDFEGVIPQGQYGGGTVMLWDRGEWEPLGDARADYAAGKLKFRLHGAHLQGGWTLVRMRGRAQEEGRDNWLLIKERDEAAQPGNGDALVEHVDQSALSHKSMAELQRSGGQWISAKPDRANARRKRAPIAGAKRGPLRDFIAPQLAKLVERGRP